MADDAALRRLMEAIASADEAGAIALLKQSPTLARTALQAGATRDAAAEHYLCAIHHYVYAGDTALHVAAAAHHPGMTDALVRFDADTSARNRQGATPLHYAADGVPGSTRWNPTGQAETIARLIAAGADPDALDSNGVAPLHRAVRTRCAAAVEALLRGGADVHRRNKRGSTAMALALTNSGRGGSGSAEAKAQQAAIIDLLQRHGATR